MNWIKVPFDEIVQTHSSTIKLLFFIIIYIFRNCYDWRPIPEWSLCAWKLMIWDGKYWYQSKFEEKKTHKRDEKYLSTKSISFALLAAVVSKFAVRTKKNAFLQSCAGFFVCVVVVFFFSHTQYYEPSSFEMMKMQIFDKKSNYIMNIIVVSTNENASKTEAWTLYWSPISI